MSARRRLDRPITTRQFNRVLSRLFRRLFLEKLVAAHEAGCLRFFGKHLRLADAKAFARYLAPLRKLKWVTSWFYYGDPLAGYRETARQDIRTI